MPNAPPSAWPRQARRSARDRGVRQRPQRPARTAEAAARRRRGAIVSRRNCGRLATGGQSRSIAEQATGTPTRASNGTMLRQDRTAAKPDARASPDAKGLQSAQACPVAARLFSLPACAGSPHGILMSYRLNLIASVLLTACAGLAVAQTPTPHAEACCAGAEPRSTRRHRRRRRSMRKPGC